MEFGKLQFHYCLVAYEYKFSADAWTIQEMNDPTAPCTNGNAVYTNRTLSVGTSDITLSVVCWGSCDPCVYPPQAPAGVTCSSGNPGFVFTDDLEATAGWTGVATSGNGTWRIDAKERVHQDWSKCSTQWK